jgi:hypothetical protein
MDAALKDNHRLKRKASKAKEVVDEFRMNLKGARIDVCHCIHQCDRKKHEHMLNTMRNVANETMKASNDLHASQLESKDNEIMNIFSPLYEEIPPLKEYLDYHFEEKEGNVIGSCKEHERVLAMDEAMVGLFFPQKWRTARQQSFAKSWR